MMKLSVCVLVVLLRVHHCYAASLPEDKPDGVPERESPEGNILGFSILVFHINKRPMLVRQQNLRLVQIGRTPHPHLFSAFWWHTQLISCDMTYLWQTIFHASLNMWQKSLLPKRKKIWDWIYPLHAICNNFGSAGRKSPDPKRKNLRLDLSISSNFQQLWFSCWKSLFMRDLDCIVHVEYPWSPYNKSTHRFLLSKYLL